jgi:hypothetical protein
MQRDGDVRFRMLERVPAENLINFTAENADLTCCIITDDFNKHLPNYLNEFQFCWNTRKIDDGERVARAIKQIDGKRLLYRESVECPPYQPRLTGQMEAPF